MPPLKDIRIFSGTSHPELAANIAKELGAPLGKALVSTFADGEIRVKIDESVRGDDIFIIQSGCCSVNNSIMELLIMIDAFRRASAKRINVVMPYYPYSRQDKKIQPREPVTAKLLANLITWSGASRMLTIDLHAGQIQGFFDVPVDHLYAGPIIADYLRKSVALNHDTVVVSPDVGGVPRATALAEALGAPIAIIAKRRPEPNRVEVMEVIGDVKGKAVVMIDDMIDTGGSVAQGAIALIERGAKIVYACCTHPVFSDDAPKRLTEAPIEKVIVTDTLPLPRNKMIDKVVVISVAPLLADAIGRINTETSVSALFSDSWAGYA
ncbi:MAG: ribose-phosphate pyrophosphokinase [Armatimonadota bacterium]|nr:ribose-phosphate pyrophosphokinase [Armatimonadota bacterium]